MAGFTKSDIFGSSMTDIFFLLYFIIFSFVFDSFFSLTATAMGIPLTTLKLSCTNQLKLESLQNCQISGIAQLSALYSVVICSAARPTYAKEN